MATFKKGDVVQLKSGGPKMTIISVAASDGDYRCAWFSGSKHETGYFPHESLVVPQDDSKK
jgi:uncharacterized protein YodC (DUF2158 family)